MQTNQDLMGSKEVCRLLDVERSTLTRWVQDGRLRIAYRAPGRNGALIFNRADVEAFKAHRDAATVPA